LLAQSFQLTEHRLVREAKLFEAKLGPIDGAGNVGKFLMQLAEGKPVVQPAAEPEPKKSDEKEPTNGAKEADTATEGDATS
jgi:vacuolar protein sorting-associated protein 54